MVLHRLYDPRDDMAENYLTYNLQKAGGRPPDVTPADPKAEGPSIEDPQLLGKKAGTAIGHLPGHPVELAVQRCHKVPFSYSMEAENSMNKYAYRFSEPPHESHRECTTIPATVLKDFNGMSLELLNVLDCLMPGDGNGLLAIAEKQSVDWPSIEHSLIDCIASDMHRGSSLNPNPASRIEGAAGWLTVRADHLVDDYWWVECELEHGNGASEPPKTVGGSPAVAILRIQGSHRGLPYTAATSPRITLNAHQ